MKTVLITGASRGVGLEIAKNFASLGYNLHLTCKTNIDKLNSLAESLVSEYGISVTCHQADCGNYEDMKAVFEKIPSLDVLVNNAGISFVGLLQDMSPEEFDEVIRTNLTSSFYSCKLAIPKMLARGTGSIINISSVWGEVGASCEVAYSASKSGLIGFSKALAKELAPSNIRVNVLELGLIDTDMNKCFSKEDLDEVCEDIPMGRMGLPSEAGRAVVLLAEAPEYMTGSVVKLDGGWI